MSDETGFISAFIPEFSSISQVGAGNTANLVENAEGMSANQPFSSTEYQTWQEIMHLI